MSEPREIEFTINLGHDVVVSEAVVVIYAITESEPEMVESRVVEGARFTTHLPEDGEQSFYVVSEIRRFRHHHEEVEAGDRTVQLVAVFTRSCDSVVLSEQVTVATVYCFARFMQLGHDGQILIRDRNQALSIAYGMKNNFVGADGEVSTVIRTSPNGMETNSFALFNFLSNLVYYSLTSREVYAELIRLTETESLLGAIHRLPHEPFTEVDAIYSLISDREQIYRPSLPGLEPPATPIPDQWTLTIKVNDSGAENFMIAGVGYIDFDKNDRVWLANNVRQGTPNSATFCVILEPDGSPAPFSPLFGGGLLGPGFGVAAHPSGERVYFGNYGWGPTEYNPQTGGISAFSHKGEVLSPSNGYTAELSRVQGLAFDRRGNLWMCSWGTQDPMPYTESKYNYQGQNSAIVVYLDGDPKRALSYPFDSPYHLTFDVAFDDEGHAYVSNSGYGGSTRKDPRDLPPVASSVYKFRIEDGGLCCVASWVSPKGFEALRQITVGPDGHVYVVAVKTSRVIRLNRDLEGRGDLTNNVHGPWGIGFDPEGTMFVANFVRDIEFETSASEGIGPHGVTVIRGYDDSTAKLMTLPTGGHEVTLANKLPLYGDPKDAEGKDVPLHSFDPLMRLTSTRIDYAGNLWACNNWKPSAAIDVKRGNPGGDGIVIFVGVAEPQPRP